MKDYLNFKFKLIRSQICEERRSESSKHQNVWLPKISLFQVLKNERTWALNSC
jgi:hypothetical protein